MILTEIKKACKSILTDLPLCPGLESPRLDYQLIVKKIGQIAVKDDSIGFVRLLRFLPINTKINELSY